ncbi:hypothetical protein SKAU_G00010650 [Synaphobranchus kaupii]|uniref:L-serine ammonia-lyase n=1 Tax=Synaphobranchus kaupii TaxID=118154 RepID=A0A9Q1GA47_SYNKA|nr:hypothetical protein SKAU_G00010650 [Synaphobranchus kaupii]
MTAKFVFLKGVLPSNPESPTCQVLQEAGRDLGRRCACQSGRGLAAEGIPLRAAYKDARTPGDRKVLSCLKQERIPGGTERAYLISSSDYSVRHSLSPAMNSQGPLHLVTPLRESLPLSKLAGTPIYLKLDSSQPTGSFKIRGIGHLCKTWAERGCERFVCCSGGNAGMAAAYSARRLGVPATIVVPVVTPNFTVQRLKDEGATVLVHGKELKESIEYGQQLVANNAGWVFISPYDDPLIWEGHTSLVRELEAELEGLRRAGWEDVPIIAMETVGAHSLNAAMEKGELVTLPKITSVATTLGLNRVAAQTLKLAQEHAVFSQLVTDQEAVMAVEHFMDDEKILVEPALWRRPGCGVQQHPERPSERGEAGAEPGSGGGCGLWGK